MDVTLACADGSTIDAHKVILSSVSTYFREILKVEQLVFKPRGQEVQLSFSECSLQAPNHHPEGYLQRRGPGDVGVCLHWRGKILLEILSINDKIMRCAFGTLLLWTDWSFYHFNMLSSIPISRWMLVRSCCQVFFIQLAVTRLRAWTMCRHLQDYWNIK